MVISSPRLFPDRQLLDGNSLFRGWKMEYTLAAMVNPVRVGILDG
jgi:hypothetical protein